MGNKAFTDWEDSQKVFYSKLMIKLDDESFLDARYLINYLSSAENFLTEKDGAYQYRASIMVDLLALIRKLVASLNPIDVFIISNISNYACSLIVNDLLSTLMLLSSLNTDIKDSFITDSIIEELT